MTRLAMMGRSILVAGGLLAVACPGYSTELPGTIHDGAAIAAPRRPQIGVASWYGARHRGRRTASGEPYDPQLLTAAHPTLPLDSKVLVTNLANGRSVEVRVNDRGPFVGRRVIDLSAKAAQAIGLTARGLMKVKVEPLPGPPDVGKKPL